MLGLIARCDNSGLGYQTLALARMLKPDKILLIDGTPFNGFRQYPERYNGFNVQIVRGIPSVQQVRPFLSGLKAVITCETFYNPLIILEANKFGVRTINQINYEFFDPLQNRTYPKCDQYLTPSFWNLAYLQRHWGARYLPPPFFAEDYAFALSVNLNRPKNARARFVHVAGKKAIHDRNGTQLLLDSLPLTGAEFDLVIYAQEGQFESNDPRVVIRDATETNTEMYLDFDAMILPRKYGGLCLPMHEALLSGLPVIMTDIEPNNKVLPKEWLVHTSPKGSFKARTEIPIHEAHILRIAEKLTKFSENKPDKLLAVEIGDRFTPQRLEQQYQEVIGGLLI